MSGYRVKRVEALIKEALSPLLIRDYQDEASGLLTVTRVEITADLRTARVHVSVFGAADPAAALERLAQKAGALRKAVASRVKLKYNPELVFVLDLGAEHEARIDALLERAKTS
ncbi:MAG: 30S ribosome-binding factor RbfA [Candidatus Aminicenantes bacterium]|nr:30S ribosome-binding factor RbfA [Candidatus Aminicenantes bacterium]